MASAYNATLEQREITLRIALHRIVYTVNKAREFKPVVNVGSTDNYQRSLSRI